ncbi:MAG: ankyrin repeat domain-containing protein [Clostridia bacterium]|nr:ankyrin repeat domain-containing protein [Clostridia bacterium]
MNISELTDLLTKSAEQCRNDKYIAWWDEDPDGMYRYNLFKKAEIEEIEACIASAQLSDLIKPCGTNKFTLFHLLVSRNFYGAVKAILERKAVNPDITDGNGKGITALMLACNLANLQMVKLLLEYGANEELTDADGRNCFHYLTGVRVGIVQPFRGKESTYNQRTAIAGLLKYGINNPDKENKTPLVGLLMATDTNISYSLFDAFIAKGADCGFVDEDGDTLLHIAIKNRHFTAALRLADGNNVNTANKAGETPLKLAEKNYCEGFCIALKDKAGVRDKANERIDLKILKNTASNAFAYGNNIDGLGIALYLAEMIINKVDTDDDDEVRYIADMFFNALSSDEDCAILDMCFKAKISFTEKFTNHGKVWCLRDECFSVRAGLKAIEKLYALGVDLNKPIIEGKTPANIVAGLNRPCLMRNEKFTFFEDSVKFFSLESMTALDNNGTSAMHLAALRGHSEMLKAMIEAGADINVTQDAPSEAGDTPLHIACFKCNTECVRLLTEKGADESILNVNGETPAHMVFNKTAICGGYTSSELKDDDCKEVFGCLKNLDSARNDGRTPLMQMQFCNINLIAEVQHVILDKGADVNKKDNSGNTALILATMNHCYKETIKELILAGADVNAANNSGKTALHCALKYGSQDVARYLIKKGADFTRADNDGVTPVQLAAEKGYDAVLELMTDL